MSKESVAMRIETGMILIEAWIKNARREDADNPALTAMAMALVIAIKEAHGGKMSESEGVVIGSTMLAAFMYGQYAGAKIELAKLAVEACEWCQAVKDGDNIGKAKLVNGEWVHRLPDGDSLACSAGWIWKHEKPDNE